METNIKVIESVKRADTTVLQFQNQAWTWADFDCATATAYKLASYGRRFIISDLTNNGGYLPQGRTALAAANAVAKNMPEDVHYWIIVGSAAVQTTLDLTRKLFPKVRFVGAKTIEEAYAFIEKQEPSALVH